MKLSFSQRLSLLIGPRATAALTGHWEGFETSRARQRGPRRLESQDAGLNYGNREALISEARRFCQCFPLATRILHQFATYCVGSCRVKPDTGDPKIDKIYQKNWENWMAVADGSGVHSFPKIAKLSLMGGIRDGDSFTQIANIRGFSRLRMIEADRVNNGFGSGSNTDTPGMIGGIRLGEFGEPLEYKVWDRTLNSGQFCNDRMIPARDIIHFFDTDRADAVRGVTQFHSVINTLGDMKETVEAMKTKVKQNSKLSIIVRNALGGAGPAMGRNFGVNPDPSQHAAATNVEEISDGLTRYMFPGEDMLAHDPQLPGGAWIQFAEFIVRLIALGMDLPFGLVWNMAGLGGPAVRFEIKQAERTFFAKQDELERRLLRRTYAAVTSRDIDSGRLPFHPGWYRHKFSRPVFVSIDAGRDSKAGIEENKAGLLTATSWYAEEGLDFEEETERLAKEAAFRQAMADKYKVPIDQIRLLTPNGNTTETANEKPEPTPQP